MPQAQIERYFEARTRELGGSVVRGTTVREVRPGAEDVEPPELQDVLGRLLGPHRKKPAAAAGTATDPRPAEHRTGASPLGRWRRRRAGTINGVS